jgi:F0F1-type ATP synthase assembly protein I
MGKAATRKRTTIENSDPALDALAVFQARNMLVSEIVTMGWKLALMVLLPIFIGVQLDNRFNTKPSLTLAAFFIAIFGAGVMIFKTYNDLMTQAALEQASPIKKKVKKNKTNV